MSNTTVSLVEKLNIATFWINQIVPVLQIAFGTFGNVFNIIIFIRRPLCINPCSTYFLVGSVNNCFVIYVALLTRYLASSWDVDPSATNTVLCKLRNYFIYPSLTLVLWFVALASIDRFLSSSPNARFRQMSSLSAARKNIACTTLLIFLSYAHVLIYFGTAASGSVSICIFYPYQYIVFLSFFGPLVSCILPIVLMSVFGILMILNVRNRHNRVDVQANNARLQRLRSNDRQLLVMVLFQVLITTLISTPYFALAIYNAVATTILQYKLSTSGQAIYNFAYNLFRLLYFTNPVIAFYIYTLTAPRFRVEMKRCTQDGLKSAVSVIGLTHCLPLRAQQALFGHARMGGNNQSTSLNKRGNAVRPILTQRSIDMITIG